MLVVIHLFGLASTAQTKVSSRPHTCWGWIKGHSEVDGGRVKQIRGVVVDPAGEPVAGALIEVFAYNNDDLDKRTRVAFQIVHDNGTFRFKNLHPGKYELRGSYCHGSGFDAGHTVIILSPKSRTASSKASLVTLNISQ